jgi:valyl-tRNA synthetase
VAGSGKFCSKLFNATRFALLNGATPAAQALAEDALTPADRWILDRLDEVITQTTDLLTDYQFGKAAEGLYHFAWDEVCDWYLELAKVQMPSAGGDPERVSTTQQVLGVVLDGLLRLLHPFVPFVTETLWTSLTGGESLMIADWPTPSGRSKDAVAAGWVADVDRLVTEIRRFRADQGVPPTKRVPAALTIGANGGAGSLLSTAAVLARLEPVDGPLNETASIQVALAAAGTVTVRVDTSSTIDIPAEIARAEKDLAVAEKEVTDTAKRLGNPQFLQKAKPEAVEKIRDRATKAAADVTRLTERLATLRGTAG